MPSFKTGHPNIPEDMIAQIHKGERIIPANQNNPNVPVDLKNANSSGTVYNIDMTINGGNANANDIANQVISKLKVITDKNNKSNMVKL